MMTMDSNYSFPKYADGEVSIMVTATKSYQLHASVLKRNSPFFAKQLVDPPRLNAKARQEHLAAYRFELHGVGPQGIGHFVRKVCVRQAWRNICLMYLQKVTDSGRVVDSSYAYPDLDGNRITEQKARYWDWLFQTFYGKAPEFDDHNLATVLSDCMGLVDVAESVGSVDQVRENVDLALLRQDNILWQSIAGNPEAWAELGRRVHSPTIFKEGVTHIVGTWNLIPQDRKDGLHADIRRVCERKAHDLDVAKEAIEMRILGHYPAFLCRIAANKPGRPSYANDIYMWMSICFFRQWFAQAISDNRTRMAADGGYGFYNALAKGGQQYLHHEDFQNFHQYFPMSTKACNVLEANMGVLKEDVKQFVADVVQVRVHLKGEENNVNWLTCALVEKEDYPWYVPDLGEDTMGFDDSFMGVQRDEESPEPDLVPPPMPFRSAEKGKKQANGNGAEELQFISGDDE